MILVTGGCFQGKTEYALEKFQISRDEAADGAAVAEAVAKGGRHAEFARVDGEAVSQQAAGA